MTGADRADDSRTRCTCWIMIRGDRAGPYGWEGDEYEITPDPDCPIHGKKRKVHPMLEDMEKASDPDG